MLITIAPSRLVASLPSLPSIRPGDEAEVILKEFKPKVYIVITEVATGGLHGTINMETNFLLKRTYGIHIKKLDGVYFAAWDQVERIYMES